MFCYLILPYYMSLLIIPSLNKVSVYKFCRAAFDFSLFILAYNLRRLFPSLIVLAICGCRCCRPHIKLSLSQECRLPVKYLITHCGAAADAQRALADKTTTAAGAATAAAQPHDQNWQR